MALSERERQMLEEMEEAIRAEDPRFASQMKGSKDGGGSDRRRIAIGVIGAVAGLGLVLLGINVSLWLGVAGFALIVAAVAFAVTPSRTGNRTLGVVEGDGSVKKPARAGKSRNRPPGRGPTSRGSAKAPQQGTFLERMEQRWEERRRGGQGF